MKAYLSPEGAKESGPTDIPADLADTVAGTANSCSTRSWRRTRR